MEYRTILQCGFCNHLQTREEYDTNKQKFRICNCTFDKSDIYYIRMLDINDHTIGIWCDEFCKTKIPDKCPYKIDHKLYRNNMVLKNKLDKI
jgi:hypothetical protein